MLLSAGKLLRSEVSTVGAAPEYLSKRCEAGLRNLNRLATFRLLNRWKGKWVFFGKK